MNQMEVQRDLHSIQINPMSKMQIVLKESYNKAIQSYSSVKVSDSKRDDIPQIVKNMKGIIDTICKDEKILNYCMEMRLVRQRDLYEKAVHTSVFAGLLAGAHGCRVGMMQNIMMAALLHDIGCLEMTFLLDKQNMSEQDEIVWKEHPNYGYCFAIQNEFSKEITDIIRYHEERCDGTGYPFGLKKDDIPLGAKIVAICANVTENIIYNGMKPYEALEVLNGLSEEVFDSKLVELFVDTIAFYNVGAMVRLSSGEVGIVTDIRKNSGAHPVVKVYYNSANRPLCVSKEIDLGVEKTIYVEEILG